MATTNQEQTAREDTKRHRIVYKLVLTGGPCAGKTTAWKKLRTYFEEQGWKVYAVHEVATLCFQGGADMSHMTTENHIRFQNNMLDMALQNEKVFFDLAAGESSRKCIVLCDRGILDISAFMKEEWWKDYLSSKGLDLLQLRDGRYDQVLHLVTAAIGATQHYMRSSDNFTRYESAQQSAEVDKKLIETWQGHPCYDIIDNSGSFDDKMRRTIQTVCTHIEEATNEHFTDSRDILEYKFLINSVPNFDVFPSYEEVKLEHVFLLPDKLQHLNRIEKLSREDNGSCICTQTSIKQETADGKMTKTTSRLTEDEYKLLCHHQDPEHIIVQRVRRYFVWNWHRFCLDHFMDLKCKDLFLLTTCTMKMDSELKLPTFLDVGQEVTEDKRYSLYELSHKHQTI